MKKVEKIGEILSRLDLPVRMIELSYMPRGKERTGFFYCHAFLQF